MGEKGGTMARVKPDELEKAAKRRLQEPPSFTREDGSPVEPEDVPADTRKKLETARRGYLKRIAEQPDFAKRMSEAIDREDKEAVKALAKDAGLPREIKFSVDKVSANWSCSCSGCLFGFCCRCALP
jgi:hypothetical protein